MPAVTLLGYTLGGTPMSEVYDKNGGVFSQSSVYPNGRTCINYRYHLITLFGCYNINLSHLNVVDCNHEIFISVYDKQLYCYLLLSLNIGLEMLTPSLKFLTTITLKSHTGKSCLQRQRI